MSNETLLIVIASALVAMLIGFLIGKSAGGRSSHGKAAKQAKKELEAYKASVSEHFGKTADLVDNLTASYKDVFEHLGSSAQKLLSEDEVKKHLTSRAEKAITLTYLSDASTTPISDCDSMQKDTVTKDDSVEAPSQAADKKEENNFENNNLVKESVAKPVKELVDNDDKSVEPTKGKVGKKEKA